MTALRIAIVVVVLILASPIILLNVWGINMTFWTNEQFARNDAMLRGETDLPEVRDMPSGPFDWTRDRADLRDTFTTENITDQRYVTIEEYLAPEDLLRTGEAMPDEVFLPLYVAARAPVRLIAYCRDVLQTIGAACDVIYAESRIRSDGRAEMIGRLGFIPAVDLGDASQVADGDLIRSSVKLPYTGDLRPANDAPSRMAMIMQAQGICDLLRAELGNCVLSGVRFDIRELWITDLEALPEGTNPQRIDATAQFTVYADRTVLTAQAFGEKLDAMVNPG